MEERTWSCADSVVFFKTKEPFGELSNMCGGMTLVAGGTLFQSSEALYQACRFPGDPELQRGIAACASPMRAKMMAKQTRARVRDDWNEVRVDAMRWCLAIKLVQHPRRFGRVLAETGDREIVERSPRDRFWGAVAVDEERLVGRNVLGRLLMERRSEAVRGRPRPPVEIKICGVEM